MRYVSCSSYVAWGSCIISLSFLRSSCLSCPLSGDSCSSRSVRLSSALNSAASAPGTGAARDSGLSGILGGLVFLTVFAVAQPSARISSRCHIQTADGKQALASGARRAGSLAPEDLSLVLAGWNWVTRSLRTGDWRQGERHPHSWSWEGRRHHPGSTGLAETVWIVEPRGVPWGRRERDLLGRWVDSRCTYN